MAERGHFEVYRIMGDVGGLHTVGQDPAKAKRLEGPVGWGWRFVHSRGETMAQSERAYPDPGEAKEGVVDFLAVVRAATYGQRLAETIKDAVRVVD